MIPDPTTPRIETHALIDDDGTAHRHALSYRISSPEYGVVEGLWDYAPVLQGLAVVLDELARAALRREFWNAVDLTRLRGAEIRSETDVALVHAPELIPRDATHVEPLTGALEAIINDEITETVKAVMLRADEYLREHIGPVVHNAIARVVEEAFVDARIDLFEEIGVEAAEDRNDMLKALDKVAKTLDRERHAPRLHRNRAPSPARADLRIWEIAFRGHKAQGSRRPARDADRTLAVMRGITEEAARSRIKKAKRLAKDRSKS